MDYFQIIEWTTIVVTFIMMMSGIPPCISMYKTKETKDIPLPFFLASLMNSLIGLYYGVLINSPVLKVINSVGVGLWGIYILTYIMVTKDKSPAVVKLSGMVALYLSQMAYLFYVIQEPEKIVTTLGTLLFWWSNIMLATPVLEIMDVVKQKNSDGMPVSLLFGGLLCTLAWLLYGYLLNDINIYGPNILGNVVNLSRLGVLITYRGGSKKKLQ